MTFWGALVSWLPVLPILLIVYLMQRNECIPKKNIIVGVTLPWEGQRDETVLALLERYRKELKLTCWLLLAAAVPTLFIRSFGVFLTVLILWVMAVCFVFLIPYARCNKALRQIKAERGWRRDAEETVVTDLQAAAAEMRWLSPWWFLPPFVISLIPLLFERTLMWLWALDAALIPVFYLSYRYLYRSRAEVVDENTGRTLALTRIRRYNWGKCWIITAWATGLFNAGLWLTLEHVWLCMAVSLTYGLVLCIAVVSIELRVRRLQEKLTADSGRGCYVDEDDRWIWGAFYYNPNDTRILINDRVGINSTFNLARRPAQVITALLLAIVLACPLFGLWIIRMERAPVELEVTEDEIASSHCYGRWSVALADIAELEIVEDRPRLTKVSGSALENALTGQYTADGWGRITCCIDPRTGPWLKVTTVDGQIYLFGSSEAGAVEEAALSAAGAPTQAARSAP